MLTNLEQILALLAPAKLIQNLQQPPALVTKLKSYSLSLSFKDCISNCDACTDGTTCDTCSEGYYQDSDNGNTCTICEAGYYSESGATSCSPCPSGEYSIEGSSSCESKKYIKKCYNKSSVKAVALVVEPAQQQRPVVVAMLVIS